MTVSRENFPMSEETASERNFVAVKKETSRDKAAPEISPELQAELDQGIQEDMKSMVTALDNFEAAAKNAETPEQKSHLNKLRKKITKSAKRFLKLARNLSLAGLVVLGANHFSTHPKLETIINEQGQTEYVHPDDKTTHILNVLAGRDSIGYEEALDNFRGWVETEAKNRDMDLPNDFGEYDLDQIDKFLVSTNDLDPNQIINYFYDSYFFERVEIPEEDAQEIYQMIWEIEKVCGNPKIRFQTKGPGILGISFSKKESLRPYFDMATNTIYVPLGEFVESDKGYQNIIAEYSHAKQLKDNPIKFYYQILSQSLRVFSKGGFDKDKLHEAQQAEYRTEGSAEYEAHSEIEPELSKKYKKLTKLSGKKSNDKKT